MLTNRLVPCTFFFNDISPKPNISNPKFNPSCPKIKEIVRQRGSLTGPPFWKYPEIAQNDRKSANRGLENWNRPEVSIRGADQKDRGFWERECVGKFLFPK